MRRKHNNELAQSGTTTVALSVILLAIYFVPTNTFAQLINISTRGFVGTADNVMIAGFVVAGSSPVQVLVRGRGPSLSGAPFFVPGTLNDPLLQIFSGQSVIAQNDNWAATQQAEISATGLDPCKPNPGQSTAPPGCSQESAVLVTLPPGAYTAILTGVAGATGVGLIEVFELIGGSAPPSILGTYPGSVSVTQSSCQNPANNGTFGSGSTVTINGQSGSLFSGTGTASIAGDKITFNFFGTVTGGGALAGSFSTVAVPSGFQSSGTFTGSVIVKTITINFSGHLTAGDTCTVTGTLLGTRP
jgi:hypothetical protein